MIPKNASFDYDQSFDKSGRLPLALAAELHNKDTGNHIFRCNEYAYLKAKKIGMQDKFVMRFTLASNWTDIGTMSNGMSRAIR